MVFLCSRLADVTMTHYMYLGTFTNPIPSAVVGMYREYVQYLG